MTRSRRRLLAVVTVLTLAAWARGGDDSGLSDGDASPSSSGHG